MDTQKEFPMKTKLAALSLLMATSAFAVAGDTYYSFTTYAPDGRRYTTTGYSSNDDASRAAQVARFEADMQVLRSYTQYYLNRASR